MSVNVFFIKSNHKHIIVIDKDTKKYLDGNLAIVTTGSVCQSKCLQVKMLGLIAH